MVNQIKAVLFDLDDTLYDELSFVVSGFKEVALFLSAEFGIDEVDAIMRMMDLLKEKGRGKIFDHLLDFYGLYNSKLVQMMVDVYRRHNPQISLYPDSKSTIIALKNKGVKVGIITDGLHYVQKQKVYALGLSELMDLIIYTDELGQKFWKPHPAAFQKAISLFQTNPKESIYVGNDPSKDFSGPKAVGIQSVHINRNFAITRCSCEADLHIQSLSELINFIE